MIEEIMIFVLGLLVAGLLSLFVLPLFWRRALRLTRRQVEMQMPLTMSEVVADRDRLRAEHAVERANLEASLERLADRHTEALSRAGRAEAVTLDLRARLFATEEKLTALETSHADASAQASALNKELYDSASLLQRRTEALQTLERQHRALGTASEEKRALNAALETRLGALEMRFADVLRELAEERSAHTHSEERAQRLLEQRNTIQKQASTLEKEKSLLEERLSALVQRSEQATATLREMRSELEAARRENEKLTREIMQGEERVSVLRASLDRQAESRRSYEQELSERLEFSEAKVVELRAALEQLRTESAAISRSSGGQQRRRQSTRSLKGLEVVSSEAEPDDRQDSSKPLPDDSLLDRPA